MERPGRAPRFGEERLLSEHRSRTCALVSSTTNISVLDTIANRDCLRETEEALVPRRSAPGACCLAEDGGSWLSAPISRTSDGRTERIYKQPRSDDARESSRHGDDRCITSAARLVVEKQYRRFAVHTDLDTH